MDMTEQEKVDIIETSPLTDTHVGMISSSVVDEEQAEARRAREGVSDDVDDREKEKKHKKKASIILIIECMFHLQEEAVFMHIFVLLYSKKIKPVITIFFVRVIYA